MTPLYSVSGLGSGIDWRKMIEEIMALERQPVKVLEQRKGRLEEVGKAWADIEGAIRAVDAKLDALLLGSTFQARTAVSSTPSVVTASASTGAAAGSYAVEVTALAQAHVVASRVYTDPAAPLGLVGSFEVNGKAVTLDGTESLLGIRDAINRTPDIGVTASVVDGRLVLKSSTTGLGGQIVVGDPAVADPNGILQSLGVIDGSGAFLNQLVAAQDAQFKVDGLAITRSSNTVSDVITGVTLGLTGPGSAVVEVKADVDGMAGKIKDFVDAYNAALGKLRSYGGKGGVLFGDVTVRGLESQLRRMAYDAVTGLAPSMDSLYDIGIATADRTGELKVDDAKLKDALAGRAADVALLFSSPEDTVKSVAERFRDAFRLWLQSGTGLIAAREQGVDRQVQDLADRMQVLEDRLALREQHLVTQFVQLERALAGLQAQGAWLEQRLAALNQ